MDNRDIVVIGGSSGATAPLKTILGALPENLPAAVFVVLHIPARSIGILTTVAQSNSRLRVRPAEDGMPIEPGHIYLGVPRGSRSATHPLTSSPMRTTMCCTSRSEWARSSRPCAEQPRSTS